MQPEQMPEEERSHIDLGWIETPCMLDPEGPFQESIKSWNEWQSKQRAWWEALPEDDKEYCMTKQREYEEYHWEMEAQGNTMKMQEIKPPTHKHVPHVLCWQPNGPAEWVPIETKFQGIYRGEDGRLSGDWVKAHGGSED